MAPVRQYLPELLDLVTSGSINPGLVFDRTLPLDEVAEGYRRDGRAAGDQGADRSPDQHLSGLSVRRRDPA